MLIVFSVEEIQLSKFVVHE